MSSNIAIRYAAVKEQRQAITTAIRMLNEVASQITGCKVKASGHLMAIRDLLDAKDMELFEEDQSLYHLLTK